jgi:hypothetical protein
MSDKRNQKPSATAGAAQQATDALQRGAEQMRGTAEASARLSQEMIQQASQNFEMLRRIGETLGAGTRTATADLSEYVRHTSQRQQEMAQQLSQARTPGDVLNIQTRYFQDNLKELLSLSERMSLRSAETARQAGQSIGEPGGQSRS